NKIYVNYLGIDLAAFDAENARKIYRKDNDEIILGTAGRLVPPYSLFNIAPRAMVPHTALLQPHHYSTKYGRPQSEFTGIGSLFSPLLPA
ncbi:MAG: hypothetical protein JSU70_04395, partial [Phycisphaerales bacterium]